MTYRTVKISVVNVKKKDNQNKVKQEKTWNRFRIVRIIKKKKTAETTRKTKQTIVNCDGKHGMDYGC